MFNYDRHTRGNSVGSWLQWFALSTKSMATWRIIPKILKKIYASRCISQTFSIPNISISLNSNTESDSQCNGIVRRMLLLPCLQGSICWHGLSLIPAWICNYIHYKERDEITYPFPKFNGTTVEVWKWVSNFIPHFTGQAITYPY